MEFSIDDRPILLIDDDQDVGFFMERLLRASGIPNPLWTLSGGTEAVAALSELSYNRASEATWPLIVLVDLKMPVMSGLDFLQWLQGQWEFSAIPRIVLSSSGDVRDVQRAYELGANGFLMKYPSPATFRAITRFAGESHSAQELATTRFAQEGYWQHR